MKQNNINILVIDDDIEVCEFLKEFLEENGYGVSILTKPDRALHELKRKQYHLVILDLKMPDINGVDLLKKIKEFNRDIPVIILTAYPSVKSAVETLKNDAFDYVKKPFKIDYLKDTIRNALKSKMLLIEPEKELNKKIGKKLRELRSEKKLTIKQLAERTNLSVSLISQIERAESAASISTLNKLTTVLGIKLKEFFEES